MLVLLLTLASFGLAQMQAIACYSSTSTSSTCMVTYSPWMAPQIPPISTVYEAIETEALNIINCDICMVTNVPVASTPARGQFTTKVTSPTLTQTRVACMTDASTTIRRAIRGYDPVDENEAEAVGSNSLDKKDVSSVLLQSLEAAGKATLNGQSIQDLAETVAQQINPTDPDLPQQMVQYLRQLFSAQFALQIVLSGLPLGYTCTEVRDPSVALHLTNAQLDPTQIADVICFIAKYGWSLSISAGSLLGQIQTALYTLQAGPSFTSNLATSCADLDLSEGSFVGVDGNDIKKQMCSGVAFTPSPSTWTSSTVFASAFGSVTAVMVGTVGVNGSLFTTETGTLNNGTTFVESFGATTTTFASGAIWSGNASAGMAGTGSGIAFPTASQVSASGTGFWSGNATATNNNTGSWITSATFTGTGWSGGIWSGNGSTLSATGTGVSGSIIDNGTASASMTGAPGSKSTETITSIAVSGATTPITFYGSAISEYEVWSNGAAATFTGFEVGGYEWSGSGTAQAVGAAWTGASETISAFTVVAGAEGAAWTGRASNGEVLTFTGFAAATSGSAFAGTAYEWSIVATASAFNVSVSGNSSNASGIATATGSGSVNISDSTAALTNPTGTQTQNATTVTLVGTAETSASLISVSGTGWNASGWVSGTGLTPATGPTPPSGVSWTGFGWNGTGMATGTGWNSGSGWATAWSPSGTAVSSGWGFGSTNSTLTFNNSASTQFSMPSGGLSYPQWTTSTTSNIIAFH